MFALNKIASFIGGILSLFFLLFQLPLHSQSVTYTLPVTQTCHSITNTLAIPLRIIDFTGVISFQSSIRWNPNKIQFDSITDIHPEISEALLINTDSTANGGFGYLWSENTAGERLTLSDSTILFILNYNILDTAATTPVGFSESPVLTETVIRNTSGQIAQVPSNQQPGNIQVTQISVNAILQPVSNNNNGSIDITPTSGTAPYLYDWSTGATSQNISNLSAGTYQLTITDQQNCQGIHTFEIGTTTPVSDLIASQITLKPNPCEDYIHIHFTDSNSGEIYYLSLLNNIGQQIAGQKITMNLQSTIFDMSGYPEGVYFFRISSKEKIQTTKFVKH